VPEAAESSHVEALKAVDIVFQWFERQEEIETVQLLQLKVIRDLALTKKMKTIQQKKISDFFKPDLFINVLHLLLHSITDRYSIDAILQTDTFSQLLALGSVTSHVSVLVLFEMGNIGERAKYGEWQWKVCVCLNSGDMLPSLTCSTRSALRGETRSDVTGWPIGNDSH
ncbi:hypothetical protein ANN_08214, partial [Periplaneta americana]